MKLNLVSFHGLYSQKGKNLEILVNGLEAEAELRGIDVVTSQHDYTKLKVLRGRSRHSRDMVREFMLKCLSLEFYKFPEAKLITLWHSNATFGGERALTKYYIDDVGLCEKIRIDKLLLFGSVIPRDCDWSRFPDIEVVNFVGSRDKVSWLAGKFYGMGNSGKKGFTYPAPNLNQHLTNMRHSGFVEPEYFDLIKDEVFKEIT